MSDSTGIGMTPSMQIVCVRSWVCADLVLHRWRGLGYAGATWEHATALKSDEVHSLSIWLRGASSVTEHFANCATWFATSQPVLLILLGRPVVNVHQM